MKRLFVFYPLSPLEGFITLREVGSVEKFIFKKYNIAKFYGVIQTPITKKPKK